MMNIQYKLIARTYTRDNDQGFHLVLEVKNHNKMNLLNFRALDLYQNKFLFNKLMAKDKERVTYFAINDKLNKIIK